MKLPHTIEKVVVTAWIPGRGKFLSSLVDCVIVLAAFDDIDSIT